MLTLRMTFMLSAVGLCSCAQPPPSPRNELAEPFDLVCLPVAGAAKLTFHFIPSDDKDAVIAQRMNDTELVDFETHTYENALLWKNGSESFVVDRFNGALIRKPSGEKYFCAKPGRRVF